MQWNTTKIRQDFTSNWGWSQKQAVRIRQISLLIQKFKTKLPANETVQLIDIQIQTCVLMPSYRNLTSLKHWSWGTYGTQHLHELCRFPLEKNSIYRTLDSLWICKRTTISKNCPERNKKACPPHLFLQSYFWNMVSIIPPMKPFLHAVKMCCQWCYKIL